MSAPSPVPPASVPSSVIPPAPKVDVNAVISFVNPCLPALENLVFWSTPDIEDFVGRILSRCLFPGAHSVAIAYVQFLVQNAKSNARK